VRKVSSSSRLIGAENLIELQSQYETITSIHVYSLAPHQLKVRLDLGRTRVSKLRIPQDLFVLSDAARETAEVDANQDPLEAAGTYGTIINHAARRRTGRRTPPPMQPTTAAFSVNAFSLPSNQANVQDVKRVPTPSFKPEARAPPSRDNLSKGSQGKRNASANPPQLKRDSSSIFKSFAKPKPPLKREGTDSSTGASGLDSTPQSGPEEEVMKETSDGEEDDYIPPPQASFEGSGNADRKSRKEREAALVKMMEEDDDDENDESDIIENQQPESSRQSPASQPIEEAIQISGGRRRGRRRVMKKKTIKDHEGYLGGLQICYVFIWVFVVLYLYILLQLQARNRHGSPSLKMSWYRPS
jgi:DNA polymerase delta subunit 3